MGKINMGIFYGKKYNPRNRTFSLENGENFIEGTGLGSLYEITIAINLKSFSNQAWFLIESQIVVNIL